MTEQHSQCTHNVTLRRVRATAAAIEKQLSITKDECVYSCLGYPALNPILPAPHTVIRGLSGCTILIQVISQAVRFSGQKIIESKMYEGRTESHEQLFFCMRTGNSRRRRGRW